MVEGGAPYPMLSDGGGKIGAVYGVYEEAAGVDIRGRFIIDPEGVLRAMEVLCDRLRLFWSIGIPVRYGKIDSKSIQEH